MGTLVVLRFLIYGVVGLFRLSNEGVRGHEGPFHEVNRVLVSPPAIGRLLNALRGAVRGIVKRRRIRQVMATFRFISVPVRFLANLTTLSLHLIRAGVANDVVVSMLFRNRFVRPFSFLVGNRTLLRFLQVFFVRCYVKRGRRNRSLMAILKTLNCVFRVAAPGETLEVRFVVLKRWFHVVIQVAMVHREIRGSNALRDLVRSFGLVIICFRWL